MPTDQALQTLEQQLTFKHFTSADALRLAQIVTDRVQADQLKPVALRVVCDDQIVLQYLMPGRKDAGWVARKVYTVLQTHHSSLYTFLHREEAPYRDWQTDDRYAICGGGFPLVSAGELRGAFAISGLRHDQDHALLVSSLQQLQKEETK